MGVLEAVVILCAAVGAGVINVVAGAGTLITFPTLLALGFPPVVANISNTVGLVPASITGAYGYRRELKGRWRSVLIMVIFSAIGGVTGGLLLLSLPATAFSVVVPFLLLLAAVLSAVQPRLASFIRGRSAEPEDGPHRVGLVLVLGVLATGIYGGYFGAAQGVVLLALLGILWTPDLNVANGAKNVLAGVANIVSAVLFIGSGELDWRIVGLVGIGSAAGGLLGARIGRKLPAPVLRTILIIVATVAAVVLFIT